MEIFTSSPVGGVQAAFKGKNLLAEGATLKGKNLFASSGSKFFPFRVDFFSERK